MDEPDGSSMFDPAEPVDDLDVSRNSVAFERMAEATFLSDLLQEMWFARGEVVDVLHSTVDAFGYDLVLWTPTVTRHVQLKTKRKRARTARYNLGKQLETLPAACVIVIEWERSVSESRMDLTYRWLGNGPHEPISPLGERIAKHTKANAQGVKNKREGLRVVPLGAFDRIGSMSELAARLFG
ncbi:hypothetical protein GCM10027059_14400 [Myceligenerans halotolerans]